jgi:biotin carboxyl carrier protein
MTAEPRPSRSPRSDATPRLLLAGFDAAESALFARLLGDDCEVETAATPAEVEARIAAGGVAVLACGPHLGGETAYRLLDRLAEEHGEGVPVTLVFAAGPEAPRFDRLIEDEQVYYLTRRPPPPEEAAALLTTALRKSRERRGIAAPPALSGKGAVHYQRMAEAVRRLALEPEPAAKAEALAEAAVDLADADRAYCLLYDPSDETLWAKERGAVGERRESAAVGLASYVLRSGRPLRMAQGDADPRFDRDADDPRGTGGERWLGVPIPAQGSLMAAVIIAVRGREEAEFSDDDQETLARLAASASPHLAPYTLSRESGAADALSGLYANLFRQEALEHHLYASNEQQDPLEISPFWGSLAFRAILGAVVATLLFGMLVHIDEYVSGIAVVTLAGRNDVTALTAGTVSTVPIAAGQHVDAGAELVRFHKAEESAQLARIEQEFELQLANRLRSPSDPGPEQALMSLGAERELARSRLGERTLRSPVAGTITDIRVRPGQLVNAGQLVASLVRDGYPATPPRAIILVPGEARPLLKPGMMVRLEIAGYRYAYQQVRVAEVSDEVIGPNEAKRSLGPGIAETVNVPGPVVVLEAPLSGMTFKSDDKTYQYHHGMLASAEVRVRRETILLHLLPSIRVLFGK